MVRIGIPSALFYYVYYPKWESFFEALGAEVVCSGRTTKQILDSGVREAVADACIPVKVFFGHVLSLKDKVDYLFIPRVVCTNKRTVYCPKFLGMPDMIRHGLTGIPPIIDPRLDTRDQIFAVWKAYQNTGKMLGYNNKQILNAYRIANKTHKKYKELLVQGYHPPAAIKAMKAMRTTGTKKEKYTRAEKKQNTELTIAILGYPYTVHDSYTSVQLVDRLEKMNIRILTADNVSALDLKKQKTGFKKTMFWTFSDQVIRAAKYYFESNLIDGAIHLAAFGCGPDSILNNFIEWEAQEYPHIPLMTLIIDEHSGEAGVTTRLEAFVDMIKRKKRGIHNV